MSEFMANFHFLRPWWLLLLVLLPLIAWLLLRNRQGQAELARLADASMLPLLLAPGRRGVVLPLSLLVLSWLLATLALAGPAWERLPTPLHAKGQARVIALSLSDSMLATDVKPDRLTRARFKIRDLLDASRSDQNALIAYAGAAFQVAPLTPDVDTLLNLIDTLEPSLMPVPGDNTAAAIELGVGLLQQAGVHGGEVILVTSTAGDEAAAAARAARAAGVRVSVLAVGTQEGAPVALAPGEFRKDARGNIELARLDDESLRAVAAAGGGSYQAMRTDSGDIAALTADVGNTSDWTLDATSEQVTRRWRDRGPWLLLALVPLVALAFRRGWLLLLPLILLVPSPQAQAGIWESLWYNADQQAARALAADKPEQAQKLAVSPAWRGSAAYRTGDYAKAAESFAKASGADANYNLGNALAQAGKYAAAIEAYEKALAMQPAHADALANRKAVEEWLKQQQQKKQQDSQQDQQPKQGDSKSRQQQGNKGQQGEQDGNKQDQNQQNSQAGDNPESGSSPAQSKPDSEEGKSSAQDSAGSTQNPSSQGDQPEESRTGADPENAQRDEQQAAQARQDFSKQMDQALQVQQGKTGDGGEKPATKGYVLGTADANDKLDMPTSMQRALERVPDDPGGLLRRKFLLEHQRRQQGGGE